MFRAIVYQRGNLDKSQVADFGVLSANIKEDLTQKATSSIVCESIPSNVNVNDLLQIYDSKGQFIYWGIITKIEDNKIQCSQFQSFFNDNEMIVAQTSTNQKAFYNNSPVANIVKFYLMAKSQGYSNIVNTMDTSYVPTFSGLLDSDVANNYKGVDYKVVDSNATYMPYPLENEVKNLESFLYDTFNQYNRIIRPHFSGEVGGRLPGGYVEVSYIQSSGTQYIDSGVAPNGDNLNVLKMVIDAQFTTLLSSGTQMLFGTGYYNDTSSSRRTIRVGQRTSSSTTKFVYLNGKNATSAIAFGTLDTNRHTFGIDQVNSKYILDDNELAFTTTVNSNLSKTILINCARAESDGSSASLFSSAKIYSFKIWSNGTLIRDFVPCIQISDGDVGLIDIVNNVFYANSGTGHFYAGGLV